MSVSTNAILAFGFNIADEDEIPEKLEAAGIECGDDEDGYFEFENVVAREAGIVAPDAPYSDAVQNVYKAYWARKREAVAAYPLDIITHCSGECPMQFLSVRGTEFNARRGTPERIENLPAITPQQIQAMRAFCTRYEIEWQEPAWHLFSMWN